MASLFVRFIEYFSVSGQEDEMVGTEGTWGDKGTFRDLVGKVEGKRPF